MAEVINSGRGKILIHMGYRYQRNRTRPHLIYWRCSSTHCRATLSTAAFDIDHPPNDIEINHVSEHNHPPELRRIARQNFVNEIRNEIRNDPSLPVRRVYNAFLVRNERGNDNEVQQFPRFESIRSALNRTRALEIPPIPENINAVDIPGEWAETLRGDMFLKMNNRDRGILIFQTDHDVRLLARCQTVFLDGTFKTAPHPFTQVFTIHGLSNGYVLKFSCSLICNKEQQTYRYVLAALKNEVQQLTGKEFHPERVVIDFEAGLKGAIVQELPQAAVIGCFFHFCQAIWRKVQQLGLAVQYNQNEVVRRFIRNIMALGFVPINFVRLCCQNLLNDPATVELLDQIPELDDFCVYFQRTWMRQNGVFPPAMWNVHNRPMEFRTNNYVESFHKRWNMAVGVNHPSLWTFITRLKDEQTNHEQRIREMMNGDPPPLRRLKWRRLEERITRLRQQLENGGRNLDEYWAAVRNVIIEFAME